MTYLTRVYIDVFQAGKDPTVDPTINQVNSIDSLKFLTKAELVEQIVRPIEEGDIVDSNWTALLKTEPVSAEDAAFREWLNNFPTDRRFSPAALRYAAAIFTEGEGLEAVEPLVTLHNNIPLPQFEAFLSRVAEANDVHDLLDVPDINLMSDSTPSPNYSRVSIEF